MKIFCLSILFKPILSRLFFRVDYEFEVFNGLNFEGKPQFSKICKKCVIFGKFHSFWSKVVSKSISGFGSRPYVNLLIELNILVPNLIGFEEKLSVKFSDPKDIYYYAIDINPPIKPLLVECRVEVLVLPY